MGIRWIRRGKMRSMNHEARIKKEKERQFSLYKKITALLGWDFLMRGLSCWDFSVPSLGVSCEHTFIDFSLNIICEITLIFFL